MSEKKVFKQMRLPFQLISSPKTPTTTTSPTDVVQSSVEKSPPKTPKTSPKANAKSRKRKPSSEGENIRSTKIGRLTSSTTKENIAEQDVTAAATIEVTDSDNEKDNNEAPKDIVRNVETTDSVIHIKLPSRRKQDLKTIQKPSEEEDPDDSVVYLDQEELTSISTKKTKKSAKKSEKKRKAVDAADKNIIRIKKSLTLNEDISENSDHEVELIENDEKGDIDDDEPMEIDQPHVISDQISKLMNASGTTSISPVKDMQDMLSDDENEKSPNDQSFNTSINNISIDNGSKSASKNLTPKALARREEFERRRIEKELLKKKEREEKEQIRLKEKEQREEAKRKEKEEKEQQRLKEKEEREKKRLAELEKKEEEKRQKEEERKRLVEQKEEEKRQKEEERKRQNEARDEEKRKKEAEKQKEEERKKKTAQAFTKFFVPVKKKAPTPMLDDEASKESAESSEVTAGNFMPFQIHGKMRLAPCVRYNLSTDELKKLDAVMHGSTANNETYLKELKNGHRIPKSSHKTWPLEEKAGDEDDDDEDIMVVDELQGVGEGILEDDDAHLKMKHRAKFLMFCENRRPAFYGTWRKKSGRVYARRPFAQDPKYFDYEVDSDDEWEEEEPGESLHGSDSEKEKDAEEEDYEVDNDFFVPHGHLSDDELNPDGEEVIEDNSPEAQKAKLKILQQEFAAEMKKKTKKLEPRLIGCIWMNGDEDEDGATKKNDLEKKYHCSDIIWRILKAREMWCSNEEIKMEDLEPEVPEIEEVVNEKTVQQKTPAQQKVRPKIDNEDSTKDLIRLVHGNTNSKKYLIREFQAYRLKKFRMNSDFQEFSVKSVEEKMMEVAVYKSCPDDGPLFGKKCWYVKPDVVKQYFGDEKLPIPNQWTYILEKEIKEKKPKPFSEIGEAAAAGGSKKSSREVSPIDSTVVNQPGPSIASNKTSQVQQEQQPKPSPIAQKTLAVNSSSGKKRVQLLMSVPRGGRVDEEQKNSLISQYLSKNNEISQNKKKKQEDVKVNVDDDGIVEIID